jgi:hypothetical protein
MLPCAAAAATARSPTSPTRARRIALQMFAHCPDARNVTYVGENAGGEPRCSPPTSFVEGRTLRVLVYFFFGCLTTANFRVVLFVFHGANVALTQPAGAAAVVGFAQPVVVLTRIGTALVIWK